MDETQAGENFRVHAYARSEGVAASLVTDQEYPPLAAQQILSKILDEFVVKYPRSSYESYTQKDGSVGNPCPFPSLKEYMKNYQDPKNVDSIMKIQQELDETKIVLHKTIENVLERGEKIDDLVQKSNNLSESSKKFYTAVRKPLNDSAEVQHLPFIAEQKAKQLLYCHVKRFFKCNLALIVSSKTLMEGVFFGLAK